MTIYENLQDSIYDWENSKNVAYIIFYWNSITF